MTHGAALQQELERFFGALSTLVEIERERCRACAAVLRPELEDFFGGLVSEVETEERIRRALQAGLQEELGKFLCELNQQARTEEKRRGTDAADLTQDLTGMFGLLEPTIAAATVALKIMEEREEEERDRRTGRQFSTFELVRTQELDLSRIFQGLLDPMGSHSQGDLFLSLLLEELSAAPGKAAEVLRDFRPPGGLSTRVKREQSIESTDETLRGFIDLVLELEHNRWIGIENKPWALDRPEQVPKYLYALLDLASRGQPAGGEGNVIVLYLSGDGSGPDLDVCSKKNRELPVKAKERIVTLKEQGRYWKNWLIVPYRHEFLTPSVEGWLRRCCVECEAERVRLFLYELVEYIRKNFANSTRMGTILNE